MDILEHVRVFWLLKLSRVSCFNLKVDYSSFVFLADICRHFEKFSKLKYCHLKSKEKYSFNNLLKT